MLVGWYFARRRILMSKARQPHSGSQAADTLLVLASFDPLKARLCRHEWDAYVMLIDTVYNGA